MIAPQPDDACEAAPNSLSSDRVLTRKKRDRETEQHRSERREQQARARIEQTSAEEKAVDAAVRRSIKLYGA